MIVLKLTLIILAAICKAVCDKIANHGDNSIFFTMSEFWWKKDSGSILPYTKYRWNAWHLSGSLMVVFFIAATCVNVPFGWYIQVPILGILFTLIFNLFYNKILK